MTESLSSSSCMSRGRLASLATLASLAPLVALVAAGPVLAADPQAANPNVYYQCPGNVFTNTITPREAEQRGCKSREVSTPLTIAAPARTRAAAPSAAPPARAGSGEMKVDPAEQKARDTDARRILEAELRKTESQLDTLRKEFNNGEPERKGDERNYQRYLDRVAEMKAAIARSESDVAALKRELAKLP